jgi:hypothetical protein
MRGSNLTLSCGDTAMETRIGTLRAHVILRKAIRLATGMLMLLVGIAGLILPILPGWLFIIPGLIVLADYFPPIRRLLDWAKRRARRSGVRVPEPAAAKDDQGPSAR